MYEYLDNEENVSYLSREIKIIPTLVLNYLHHIYVFHTTTYPSMRLGPDFLQKFEYLNSKNFQ